jgi:hypothetical protein
VRDPSADVAAGPDLTRVSLGRAADGRLRAAFTMAQAWSPADMLADKGGPPGSACLRLWTVAEPPNVGPDYLVCVTAQADGKALRATITQERDDQLPRRVAEASVSRRGDRSVVVRFSQTAIGRPALVRFAAEATRAGCERVRCVDTAPDAPATAEFRLRRSVAATGR